MSADPLYQHLLGPAWEQLAPEVQRLHAERTTAEGEFRVRRGLTRWARLLGALLRMPAAGERVRVTLRIARASADGQDETWQRVFAAHPLDSRQWARAGLLVESLGPIQCVFRLLAVGGALVFEQVGAAFGVGAFRVPLPRFLAPRVTGRATYEDDAVHVEVTIGAPLLGLIVGYDGRITC